MDAGAALQNRAFAENCLSKKLDITFKVLVTGPAQEVFNNSFLPKTDFDFKTFDNHKLAKYHLEQEIFHFQPDFVMVGLSYLGDSIDEIILEIAREKLIPCGVIQDYWGYIGNFDLGSLPDVFFVLDQEASRLTTKKIEQVCLPPVLKK